MHCYARKYGAENDIGLPCIEISAHDSTINIFSKFAFFFGGGGGGGMPQRSYHRFIIFYIAPSIVIIHS